MDDFKKLANRGSRNTTDTLAGERTPGLASTQEGTLADQKPAAGGVAKNEPLPSGRPGSLSRPGAK
jgi:hypothetical protein